MLFTQCAELAQCVRAPKFEFQIICALSALFFVLMQVHSVDRYIDETYKKAPLKWQGLWRLAQRGHFLLHYCPPVGYRR
jgi:hypothetical protein